MAQRAPEFDVALSFAGEDRAYVERVARELSGMGFRVFYDKHETVTLWGRDLYAHLREVYCDRARYTVMFISRSYRRRLWSNHERMSAQARAFRERKEYILPARFDGTRIPGVLDTTGYVDLTGMPPRKLAKLIKQKLGPIERPHYLPPVLDQLWLHLKASSPTQMDRSERVAQVLFRAMSLMTKRERQIVGTAVIESCRGELPKNVHIPVEYLGRLVHASRRELTATFARLDCLGLTTRIATPTERDGHLGEGERIELSYYSSVGGLRGYDNRVLSAVFECLAETKCNQCIKLALDKLDFSPLSSLTANPPHQ